MTSVHLNWLTILVSAVVTFAMGGVWYSPPVFGKIYAQVVGHKPTPQALGLSFVMTIASAILIGVLVSWVGAFSFKWGALLGVVTWGAVFGTWSATNLLFEPERGRLTVVNATFFLVQSVVLGAAIGHWQ